MNTPSSSIRDLARRLFETRATRDANSSDSGANDAARVYETLRISLTRFAGADGFAALFRHALVLASAEEPALEGLKLGPNSELEGLAGIDVDATLALVAYVLELLVTFIGEPLTLRLVREGWPDVSKDKP